LDLFFGHGSIKKHRIVQGASCGVREKIFLSQRGRIVGSDLIVRVLEHVQEEMMAPVVGTIARVIIIPLPIVDRDLHFGWITVIEAVAAAIVLVSVEILGIVDVGVVLKPGVVSAASPATPSAAVSVGLLSLRDGRA
jgi:hypothetical protein